MFRAALGIEAGDWEYLRDAILDALPDWPVSGVREPRGERDAYTWEVRMPIRGLGVQAGRRALIITAWQMVDGGPRLASLRVAPKRRQPPSFPPQD